VTIVVFQVPFVNQYNGDFVAFRRITAIDKVPQF